MARKNGRFSLSEKYYIESHCDTKDIKEIAQELDRTIKSVEEYSNEFKSMRNKAGGQFANNRKGSVCMTPNASIMADESKSRKKRDPFASDCVTRIKRDR